jgi:hypothetical protein
LVRLTKGKREAIGVAEGVAGVLHRSCRGEIRADLVRSSHAVVQYGGSSSDGCNRVKGSTGVGTG